MSLIRVAAEEDGSVAWHGLATHTSREGHLVTLRLVSGDMNLLSPVGAAKLLLVVAINVGVIGERLQFAHGLLVLSGCSVEFPSAFLHRAFLAICKVNRQ